MYRQPMILGFRSSRESETNLRKSPSEVPPIASLTWMGELTFGYVLRSAESKRCHAPICAIAPYYARDGRLCGGKFTQWPGRRVLYGIHTIDGISLGGVSLLFLAVAVLAALIPSQRALRVEPVAALRCE